MMYAWQCTVANVRMRRLHGRLNYDAKFTPPICGPGKQSIS
jgi:hypothetical protein